MSMLITGLRIAGEAARNNNSQQQQQADQPPPGSTPAPAAADCSQGSRSPQRHDRGAATGVRPGHARGSLPVHRPLLRPPLTGRQVRAGRCSPRPTGSTRRSPRPPGSTSPHRTYGAGKTRVMKLTSLLCPNPQMMAKITGPAIYHIIPERHPAPLGLDEADALFGPGSAPRTSAASSTPATSTPAPITRVVKSEATDYSVFCPVMFAGQRETAQVPRWTARSRS